MQEAAFEKLGIKAHYLVLELPLQYFRTAMRELKRSRLDGFNITVPYKEEVLKYADRLTPEARAIGAVNTVYRNGSQWIATNTDVFGFLKSLKEDGHFRASGKKILILGAGGSARAVAYGLARERASTIFISNRHLDRAEKITDDFKTLFPKVKWQLVPLDSKRLGEVLEESHLAVNATSVGLRANERPLIPERFIPSVRKKKILFFDLIYRPAQTSFLKAAARKGQKTLNGLGMLVYQGAKSFQIWTGKKAPISVMRTALMKGLKCRGGF